jgi:hypothetical protein
MVKGNNLSDWPLPTDPCPLHLGFLISPLDRIVRLRSPQGLRRIILKLISANLFYPMLYALCSMLFALCLLLIAPCSPTANDMTFDAGDVKKIIAQRSRGAKKINHYSFNMPIPHTHTRLKLSASLAIYHLPFTILSFIIFPVRPIRHMLHPGFIREIPVNRFR